jgi:site-specific DNA recombinase
VSTEAQEAKGTIGSQLDALRARVAANGDELVTEFVDDGHSGARLDRPGLDAARDAAQAGTVEAIWCLSPDRLARSFAYQMLILDELARLGVTVCFTDSPPIDSDPQARLLVQVQGVIAEYERAKFSERERRGKMYRARAGEVLSHKVPYGYRREPRSADRGPHVVVCEPEAAVVRRIFADYLGGATIRHLVVVLADDGVASPDGKAMWRLSSIFRVLRNEAYVGRLYWNRTHTSYDPAIGRDRLTRRPRQEWIEIPIPAIIDEGTFDAVQHAARDNTTYSRRRTETNTFLLRTLLRCDRCGVKLVCHRARRNEEVTRYYLCPHRDRVQAGGNDRRCSEPRIRADELDTFVFDQVRVLLTRPDLLAAGETAVVSGQPTPDDELLSAQLGHLQRRLEATAAERRRLARCPPASPRRRTRHAHRPAGRTRPRQQTPQADRSLRHPSGRRDRPTRLRWPPTATTPGPRRRQGARLAGRPTPTNPARRRSTRRPGHRYACQHRTSSTTPITSRPTAKGGSVKQ